MRSFTKWILGLFASPIGVFVLAALDSTLFFSLPFGIDAVVIILAARMHGMWWLVAVLASLGSIAGASITFWMGVKAGEKGLDRFASEKRLKRIRERIQKSGAIALAVLDLIPPPFPFTVFVLAAGALEVKPTMFFGTLAVCRLLRFGVEAALAQRYGRTILAWMDSDVFRDVIMVLIVLAFALTALSIFRLVKSTRPQGRRAAA
jgi:membrane protein YqaA with SNARE-associated domain